MWAVIAGAMATGAVLMGRTKPKTRVRKKLMLGRVSGRNYAVEDFEEAGVVVAKSEDGSASAALLKSAQGLRWHKSLSGSPSALRTLYVDLCAPAPPPGKKE